MSISALMGLFGWNPRWIRHSLRGALLSLVLAVFAFPLFVGPAQGPEQGGGPPRELARLVRDGDRVAVEGSLAHLFDNPIFVGPSRGKKTNRARLTPDGVAVATGFTAIRRQIAEARLPKPAVPAMRPPVPVTTVASAAALEAIERTAPVTPQGGRALAYARAPLAPATVAPAGTATAKYSQKEHWCLATAVYFEARSESYNGQVAVAQVVMNRLAHRLYPKTICGVVFQNQHMRNACQFSFACDGIPERVTEPKSWAQAEKIATDVLRKSLYLKEVGRATHYHATYVYPHWAPRLRKIAKVGLHIFYRFKSS